MSILENIDWAGLAGSTGSFAKDTQNQADVGRIGVAGFQAFGGIQAFRRAKTEASALRGYAGRQENAARLEALRVQGARRAAYAAAGLDPNSGSPLDVMLEAAYHDEVNAQNAGYAARFRAYQIEEQGEADLTFGLASATTTILGGMRERPDGKGKLSREQVANDYEQWNWFKFEQQRSVG